MELKMYLDILARRWRIALIIAVAIVILFALGSLLMSPDYQAQVMLRVITPVGGNSGDVQYQTTFAARLMNTYAQIATSDEMLRELRAKLGVKSLPIMNAVIVPDSEIFQVTAESSDAKLAINAANGLADILASYQNDNGDISETDRLDVLAQRKTALEGQLVSYQQQHDDLVKSYSETTAKMSVLESAIRGKEAALQSVQSQYELATVADLAALGGTTRATKAGAATEMENLQKELDALNQQYSDISQGSSAYLQQITLLRQTIQSTQSAYSTLLTNYDSVALSNIRQQNAQNVVIVSRAAEPLKSTGLGRGFVVALGVVFGIIIGIVGAFLLENLGIRVRIGSFEA
jgi:uncharacterized protein involved in exopolysaccharide biosynthesis